MAEPPRLKVESQGTGFLPGAAITIGGVAVVTSGSTALQFVAPIAACDATVVVTNPDGQSATARSGQRAERARTTPMQRRIRRLRSE